MTTDQLKEFFSDRPALSRRMVAKESGIHNNTIESILKGRFNLTQDVWTKLKPVLEKYGYKPVWRDPE